MFFFLKSKSLTYFKIFFFKINTNIEYFYIFKNVYDLFKGLIKLACFFLKREV